MKEWFLTSELLDHEGMPSSRQAIAKKAKRNNWLKRKAKGEGRSLEYHISNLHEDIQKSLIARHGTDYEMSNIDNVIIQLKENAAKYKANEKQLSNVSKEIPLNEISDWCTLPVYDVHAAAGAGTLIQSEYQIGTFQLPCVLLHEYGLNAENSSIIFVDGDSMEPTLTHKDKLLVDIQEYYHPVSNGVYVIRIDDAVYVKRLHWDIENGLYNIISDNSKYAPFKIDHNNGRNFKIIGKVITIIMKPVL
ncbi:peptidase [Photobacterium frigidiphilum]|uniref:helix-turn-helix domain-containing protein n=1 Tax=Photobacterium frigidiphilum TaxID=264736 RepID=UPI003D0D30BA